jgi:hypothetical protein
MHLTRRVNVDRQHVHQLSASIPGHQRMVRRLDTLVDDMPIPAVGARHTAEDELDGRVEQLQGFGPLPRFEGVGFFCGFFDLPGTPDFVAYGPVFDLMVC